jgi:hypothetical protein
VVVNVRWLMDVKYLLVATSDDDFTMEEILTVNGRQSPWRRNR